MSVGVPARAREKGGACDALAIYRADAFYEHWIDSPR